MPSNPLFRADAYLIETEAEIIGINERGGIILSQTVFYPTGGGQPGDAGVLVTASGTEIPIATTVYGTDKSEIVHVPAEGAALPALGERVTARIDWPTRLKRMRIHTALHLLTTVLPYPVTGGAIGDGEGRLDFDIPDAGLDKDAIGTELMRRIRQNAAVTQQWITDAELEAMKKAMKKG